MLPSTIPILSWFFPYFIAIFHLEKRIFPYLEVHPGPWKQPPTSSSTVSNTPSSSPQPASPLQALYRLWCTAVKSPLSLRRDSFISPDIEDFFSVLTLNFAFLPQKLMVSHSQGFCSLCPAFVVFCQHFCIRDYKVLLTVWTIWWWRGFSLKKVITG